MRCNNRHDLLKLDFTLKFSIFSQAYSNISQSNYYDGAFIAKIKPLSIFTKSSITDACLVLNTPLLFEDSLAKCFISLFFLFLLFYSYIFLAKSIFIDS